MPEQYNLTKWGKTHVELNIKKGWWPKRFSSEIKVVIVEVYQKFEPDHIDTWQWVVFTILDKKGLPILSQKYEMLYSTFKYMYKLT